MQHTQGPWWFSRAGTGYAIGSGDYEIATVGSATKTPHDDAEEANARLIAAAPDMLASLEECITDEGAACHTMGAQTRRLEAINAIVRAAIAKAKGESEC